MNDKILELVEKVMLLNLEEMLEFKFILGEMIKSLENLMEE